MNRLIEITFDNDKEIQALYPYESKDALEGDFEYKLGVAMEANADKILVGIDNTGSIIFMAKTGDHVFSPRLYEAKYTNEEQVNLAKYDSEEQLHARFHNKKGAAIKNLSVIHEVLVGLNGAGNVIESCNWVRTYEPEEPEQSE
jgi:hypothetical protein